MTTHVLFDFFGTLVEYSPSYTEQGYPRTHALLRAAGSPLDYEAFLALWSETAAGFEEAAARSHREFSMADVAGAFLERAVGRTDETLVRAFVRSYIAEWNRGVRYADAVAEMLQGLRERFTLAVVSNTNDADVVPDHLRAMGVHGLFREIVTSVELGVRKPSPAIFEHALGRLGASPSDCVYVGDSYEADYLGADAAGIRCLLIDPGGAAPVAAERRIESVLDLTSRLGGAG